MKRPDGLIAVLVRLGLGRLLDRLRGESRLTVLAYHRVAPWQDPGFNSFKPVVSATPAVFEQQMALVASSFSVVSLDALGRFISGEADLPPRALLITFDDGYLDNYRNAFPVLRRHGIPAAVFLLTGAIDRGTLPWWEACARAFGSTAIRRADLPLLGERDLSTPAARDGALGLLVARLKRLPEEEKRERLGQLAEALGVPPAAADPGLFMSWEQVREMTAAGITFQPHTVTHPILARVDRVAALREIEESGRRVAAETGAPLRAFAYPNGQPGDYDAVTVDLLRSLGYAMAFTLSPGPLRYRAVREHPFEIPRVYIGRRDSMDTFVLKVMGVPALVARRRFVAERGSP